MEKEILDIILNMMYKDKLKEMEKNRETVIDFPVKLDFNPNFKVLLDFNNIYYLKYRQVLVENAVIFAIDKGEKEYINYVNENLSNLNTDNVELMFKIKTIDLAFKNIATKYFENINNDSKIKKENSSLFNSITKEFTEIDYINLICRNIIITLIENEDEKEEILERLLNSNNYDEFIINFSNGTIDRNNIKYFKSMINRIILFDVYLYIESLNMEKEIDEHINNLYNKYHKDGYDENMYYDENLNLDNLEQNELEKINIENDARIIEYINKCIKNNCYVLPRDHTLKMNILAKFIIYNLYSDINGREYDIKTLESDNIKKLNLIKINPLYKLEIM